MRPLTTGLSLQSFATIFLNLASFSRNKWTVLRTGMPARTSESNTNGQQWHHLLVVTQGHSFFTATSMKLQSLLGRVVAHRLQFSSFPRVLLYLGLLPLTQPGYWHVHLLSSTFRIIRNCHLMGT
ncbi:hypothetical protein JAAARDRAFT_70424 [Jaapia argillacea MUCL 33604]|uniref:Uncharacterized protein n=1 Tax=Jaapia argillacea MUCL 33604 TaxID=933084 RepID=A0A067PS99_9AGAM|nr:hypothetical protein JAAARDRAFT_70424 [Jaapia argillacea MUCL 33604]